MEHVVDQLLQPLRLVHDAGERSPLRLGAPRPAEQHGLGRQADLGQRCPQLVGHARREIGTKPGQGAHPKPERRDREEERQRQPISAEFTNRNPWRNPARDERVLDPGVEMGPNDQPAAQGGQIEGVGRAVRVGWRRREEHLALPRLQVERDELVVLRDRAEKMPGNHPQRLECGSEHTLDHARRGDCETVRIPAAGHRIGALGEEDELGEPRPWPSPGSRTASPAAPGCRPGVEPTSATSGSSSASGRPRLSTTAVSAAFKPRRKTALGPGAIRQRHGSCCSRAIARSCRTPAAGREIPKGRRSRCGGRIGMKLCRRIPSYPLTNCSIPTAA